MNNKITCPICDRQVDTDYVGLATLNRMRATPETKLKLCSRCWLSIRYGTPSCINLLGMNVCEQYPVYGSNPLSDKTCGDCVIDHIRIFKRRHKLEKLI